MSKPDEQNNPPVIAEHQTEKGKVRSFLKIQREPALPHNQEDHKDGLKPSDVEKMGFFVANRVRCIMWKITDHDEIEMKTLKVKFDKDVFKYGGKEYNLIFTHKQWRLASKFGNRQLTLNYKIGEPNPISYRMPSVYVDAALQAETHRRKTLRSLLNKVETIVIVMVIGAMILAVGMLLLYVWGAVEKSRTDRQNAALIAENTQMKALIDRLQVPPAGADAQ